MQRSMYISTDNSIQCSSAYEYTGQEYIYDNEPDIATWFDQSVQPTIEPSTASWYLASDIESQPELGSLLNSAFYAVPEQCFVREAQIGAWSSALHVNSEPRYNSPQMDALPYCSPLFPEETQYEMSIIGGDQGLYQTPLMGQNLAENNVLYAPKNYQPFFENGWSGHGLSPAEYIHPPVDHIDDRARANVAFPRNGASDMFTLDYYQKWDFHGGDAVRTPESSLQGLKPPSANENILETPSSPCEAHLHRHTQAKVPIPFGDSPDAYAKLLPEALRQENDRILKQGRKDGLSYREIQDKMVEPKPALSTLRGRHRFLVTEPGDRDRKVIWIDEDKKLLNDLVEDNIANKFNNPSQATYEDWVAKAAWKEIGVAIKNNGGSRQFGARACKEKWCKLNPKKTFMM